LALDLSKPSGKDVMHRLVKNSDVFITSADKDTIRKFGLDYATLSQINPKLIYAGFNGYGDKGPDAEMPSFDMMFQARAGVMMSTGDGSKSEPCSPMLFMADEVAGITLTLSILGALLARERYGMGQEVRCSGLRATMQLLHQYINIYLLTGKEQRRSEEGRPVNALFYFYECQDGGWIAIGAHREIDWAPLCRAIDMPELEKDSQFDTMMKRIQNGTQLTRILKDVFMKKPRRQWADLFRKARLTYAPVSTIKDLVADPQVIANEYIFDYDHPVLGKIKTLGFPAQFEKTPATRTRPAPECGQHTEEILTEVCGYHWEDISRLHEEGVI
ncbi:MAG: CoA transferase, partial [Dehalococcoidia bacterium]